MPKLTRYLQKIFANNSNEVGVFGTGVDKETSKNVETLQSADYENGWSSAIITNKNYPIWQEMDGVQYGLSYQLKYLFQNGMPEWISTETYYTNQFCAFGGYIYQSLQDDNINHNPALNDGYWTVYSSVPDDRLHALKSYEDAGETLTDSEGLSDVRKYAHSTFDLSKFTVVGSPTITDDGIASGFSTSNYITFPYSTFRPESKPWKVVAKVKTASTLAIGGQVVCAINNYSGADNGICIQIPNSPTSWNFQCFDGTGTLIFSETVEGILANTDYLLELEFTGTKYVWYVNGVKGGEYVSNTLIHQNNTSANQIGLRANQRPFGGSIDLKQFSITVDGVTVFSGNETGIDTYTINSSTVTIPYTLSKTGSKIVDSAYRTQVTNVYNEFGYAPYYTLSDTDFTLPQGELYGMYEKYSAKTISDLMPNYSQKITTNNTSYTAPADGWVYVNIQNSITQIFINNVEQVYSASSIPTSYNACIYTGFFVQSGDIVSITSSETTIAYPTFTFYPLKGAN